MFTPHFTITPKLLSLISQIAEIKSMVSQAKVLPQREAVLRRQAQVRIAHTSTKIEGNPLAEYEVEKVLAGEKIRAGEPKAIQEVKNYEQALQLVESMATKGAQTLTPHVILNLHKLVLKNLIPEHKRGHWRPADIYIVTHKLDKTEVDYTGPQSNQILHLIQQLIDWIQHHDPTQLHPVITAGVIHHQFEAIHPFVDGNGRVGRLLTLLFLHLYEWDFKHLITLENYYAQDRLSYIEALRQTGKNFAAKQQADLTGWLEYFVTGFLEEANKVKETILPIALAGQTDQVFLDKDELKVLDFLATMGQMKSSDVADILSIPVRTAQAKIKDLVDKGIIQAIGKGPSTYYTLSQK